MNQSFLLEDLNDKFQRISNAEKDHFHHEIKFFFENFIKRESFANLIQVGKRQYSENDFNNDFYTTGYTPGRKHNRIGDVQFENEIHRAMFCYYVLRHFLNKAEKTNKTQNRIVKIQEYPYLQQGSNDLEYIVTDFMTPVYNFLKDNLKRNNSVVVLLNRFKRRMEWFKGEEMYEKYISVDKNYEKLLKNELMLFLFDNGIDYPISEPESPSGKSDIIANIDKKDAVVLEAKIFDRIKGYNKSYVKKGINQVLEYADNFSKSVAYLVIFNMDNKAKLRLNFKANENALVGNELIHANKTIHISILNLSPQPAASKSNKIEIIELSEADFLNKSMDEN